MNILFRYLGYILLISSIFRIIPIIAAIIYGEPIYLFIITIFITLITGIIFIIIGKKKGLIMQSLERLNLPQAFVLVAATFLIIPLISSISYMPSFNYNFINAYFESISGFTTTGFTLYDTLEGLPKSLLLWRAESQWIGGIGIVMVFLFIISRLHFRGKEETTQIETTSYLYQSQSLSQKIEPSLKKSSKNVLIIYGGYTLLGIALLYISGMDMFQSIALTFTSISTGGFLVTDTLQATNIQLGILSILMIIGSISFIAHNKLLQMKIKEFFLSFEKKIFLLVLLLSIAIIYPIYKNFKIILFELISAFTTTGYSIIDISALPHLFIMIIITGMLIGGSVASTSGGIKLSRIYTQFAMIPWMIKKLVSPRHAIIPLKINNKVIDESDTYIITVFISIYFIIIFIGTFFLIYLGNNFFNSLFQMVSALGTVGLQTMDLISLHFLGKIILIIAMLLGRLEIFPLLILIRNLIKKLNPSK